MSETTTTETTTKKSWFNRAWSAITGLIVGVATMFGVNQAEIAEIKKNAENAYDKIQQVQEAIEKKDIAGAVTAVKEASTSIKAVVSDVKENVEIAKTTYENYVKAFEQVKTAVKAKNWDDSLAAVDLFLELLTSKVESPDKLDTIHKAVYNHLKMISDNINAKKYDKIPEYVNAIEKVIDTIKSKISK